MSKRINMTVAFMAEVACEIGRIGDVEDVPNGAFNLSCVLGTIEKEAAAQDGDFTIPADTTLRSYYQKLGMTLE